MTTRIKWSNVLLVWCYVLLFPAISLFNTRTGVTILSHDQPNQIFMKHSSGVTTTFNYTATIGQLKALTSLSASCRQHLKLECANFSVWIGNSMKGWWVNVDGQKMNNWAGAATETIGCACSENSGMLANNGTFILHRCASVDVCQC